MKTKEIIKFLGKTFYYQKRIGKKRIYHSVGENPSKLEMVFEHGVLKNINLIELQDNNQKVITKIRTNSKNNIEISIEDSNYEDIKINDNLLSNIYVRHKKTYDQAGILIAESLSIISNKKESNFTLRKLLEEDNQYITNKKVVMTVNSNRLSKLEDKFTELITEFMNFSFQEELNDSKIEEQEETETIEVTPIPNDSYIVPSNLRIYDREYYLELATTSYLKYTNQEEGEFTVGIKLDHEHQKIKELIFTDMKQKLKHDDTKKQLVFSDEYEKGNIIRLIPMDDQNIKGLYKSHKEDVKINDKMISKTKINGEALLNLEKSKPDVMLDISTKKGKLTVSNTFISFQFIQGEETYYITSRSYAKFYNLVMMSPYILKAVEEKIWVKSK